MGKIIGVAFLFAIVLIAFLVFPDMTESIESADSATFEETFTAVATGAGATTAVCDLTQALYRGDIKKVSGIVSDNPNDFPSAYSYDADDKELTVKSLQANTSRNLTISYYAENTGGFVGLNKIFGITPVLILLAILGVAGLAIWWGFFSGRVRF